MPDTTRDLIKYKSSKGLVETTDEEVDKPLYRRPGFEGIVSFKEMDAKLAAFLRDARESEYLTRAEFAPIVGLSTAVYGRYERAFSRMTVTRMIHLCELLGFMPIDMLFAAAPHLYGRTPEEAKDHLELSHLIRGLPHEAVRNLIGIVARMTPEENPAEKAGKPEKTGKKEGR
ncbi:MULTISPECIES: helix-turn-helix transcriptional regulator [Agrobacterium]|uniref:helix-turn-helix transcriptional regulator n=1 Tax=Agrobacterium TaxID=357 RepID=UPI0009BBAC5C|nr:MULTISPECIES: helix-turn-helix transcriptional regulator [Agrobacterium]QCL77383.1 helix-turn-helix domain-containing protein [Agrobacterium tumefaciens]CUX72325.1 Helix turn helix transcriptional regulator [Agrobacterium sp. NCPPB 925]